MKELPWLNNILQKKEVIIMVLFTLLLAVISMTPFAVADSINPGVFSANDKPYGVSYAEWTGKWWKWALEIPTKLNPITDKTGANCAQNQSGPVWFLAGSNGAHVIRNCVIPPGKALLFGPFNSECSTAEDSTLKTEAQLRSCAINQDIGGVAQATVDGVPLQSLNSYKLQSPLFSFTYPKDNIFGAPPGPTQGVSDGIWVFLKPLAPGNHTIHHRGVILANPTTGSTGFASEATYNLVVK